MKKLISILIAMITAINGLPAGQLTEENVQAYVAPDCEAVAEFIADHLSDFVREYNETLAEGEASLQASYCEATMPVYITTTNQNGVYLDFDGDNGYLIVVDNYEIAAYATQGDLSYLREQETLMYSLYDGFLYYDAEGNLIPYEGTTAMTEADWEAYLQTELERSYQGQSGNGSDGQIYDPDAFVKDKYGTGYSVYNSNILKNFQYVSQYDLSIYYKLQNGTRYSEGNCSLAAIYALMNYLQASGKYTELPKASAITSYAATKDSFYNKYKQNGNYSITTPKILPKLYASIRNYAITHYGYEVGGTNPFYIATIIQQVGKQYGYTLKANHILIWSYEGQAVKEIDAGYPVIWNMANSDTYGSHSTVVTGYRTYRKTKTFLGMKLYSYVKLLALNDNWNKSVRYFDFTNYYAFGSFVQVH